MVAYRKELEILRVVIDWETRIDIVLIKLLEFFKIFTLATLRVEDFCILGRIPERTTSSTGVHCPSRTLTGSGERFFSFYKEEEKAPKPEGNCIAKGKWE